MSHISHIDITDTAFAHDFRKHVLPQLSRHLPVSAVLVALNYAGFAEEYDSIVRDAWNLGGWFLCEDLWLDLETWIMDQLLEAINSIEAEISEDEEYEHEEPPLDQELTWAAYERFRQEPPRDVFAEYAAICRQEAMVDAA